MSRKTPLGTEKSQPIHRKKNLKRALLLTTISSIIILILLFYFFQPESKPSPVMQTTPMDLIDEQVVEVGAVDLNRLIGRWTRLDGGYTLEIISAAPEGQLVAGYFNPKSINIARAEWARDKEQLYVMVELQDVNYPGSTYGLFYDPEQDKLVGKYFLAVEESTYDVAFVRDE